MFKKIKMIVRDAKEWRKKRKEQKKDKNEVPPMLYK